MSCPHGVGASICRHCSGHDARVAEVERLRAEVSELQRKLQEAFDDDVRSGHASFVKVRDLEQALNASRTEAQGLRAELEQLGATLRRCCALECHRIVELGPDVEPCGTCPPCGARIVMEQKP